MSFYTILLVAAALGTDAFSLALGMGMGRSFCAGLLFFPAVVAVFHILMPLGGLWLGELFGQIAGQIAGWVGGVLLIVIGLYMLKEARTQGEGSSVFLGGLGAVVIAAGSVSLDALTVGFGLGTMHANLAVTVLTMGAVAGLMTAAGLIFGRKIGVRLGGKSQMLGGMVLIVIGITMFF